MYADFSFFVFAFFCDSWKWIRGRGFHEVKGVAIKSRKKNESRVLQWNEACMMKSQVIKPASDIVQTAQRLPMFPRPLGWPLQGGWALALHALHQWFSNLGERQCPLEMLEMQIPGEVGELGSPPTESKNQSRGQRRVSKAIRVL